MRSDLSWRVRGETPRSDHSGSEPMVPTSRALLWVWGDARPPRLQLQSTPMAARPGRPNGALEAIQRTRARTLTHQQLHLLVQGSGLRADPVPRPLPRGCSSSAGASRPDEKSRDDRSVLLLARMHEGREQRGEDVDVASLES